MPGTNLLVLFGLLFYLGASLLLWNLLLKEPPGSTSRSGRTARPPRWPIRLAKAVATAVGGAASGGASLLLIATIVNAGKPDTMSALVKWAAWTLATVLAIFYIGRAPLIRRVVTRACLAVGLQGVVLPLATLVSFLWRASGWPARRASAESAPWSTWACGWPVRCPRCGSPSAGSASGSPWSSWAIAPGVARAAGTAVATGASRAGAPAPPAPATARKAAAPSR
jgi:hypothetical protein